MSDKLEWMNRHAVLLREPQWKDIATKENYRVRADLRTLFDEHPDSLELLDALAASGLYREGCEFIARMTHRRAAVWWVYCCLLSLLEERLEVECGAALHEPDEMEKLLADILAGSGVELPPNEGLEDLDNFCKMPELKVDEMLADYVPPPQDDRALKAASASVKAKAAALEGLLPSQVREAYASSLAKVDVTAVAQLGRTPAEALAAAKANLSKRLVTYKVNRLDSPKIRKLLQMREMMEVQRKGTVAQIKATFPEKFPTTPEAKLLLAAETKKRTDDAMQAVWRWIVSPDERNTTLAMEAGKSAAGTPEGLLAFTAAWSFGDLAPEGKMTVPVPPELPGTGLNSVLLMLALDKCGTRKMPERYELYFNMGMDVVFGRCLWADAVAEEQSPHEKLAARRRERETVEAGDER